MYPYGYPVLASTRTATFSQLPVYCLDAITHSKNHSLHLQHLFDYFCYLHNLHAISSLTHDPLEVSRFLLTPALPLSELAIFCHFSTSPLSVQITLHRYRLAASDYSLPSNQMSPFEYLIS